MTQNKRVKNEKIYSKYNISDFIRDGSPSVICSANQTVPKTDTEVEKLKMRVTDLEGKLQIVENVEKMELAAKLAEAEARLINTEFDKLKLELKDSNQQWLTTWILIILAILSVVGYALWSRLTKKDG